MSTETKTENKIDREFVLKGENIETVAAGLEADVALYTEEISSLDAEGLKKAEADLMEEFKADDEYLKNVEYELAAEVVYDDRKIKRSELCNKVIGFINRIEVDFRNTLGIYQCVRFWKTTGATPDAKIPYGAFDSTLRMLGTLKFKGENECFNILAVNNWFAGSHDAYQRDNLWTRYLSAKHQAIMKVQEELEKKSAAATPDVAP